MNEKVKELVTGMAGKLYDYDCRAKKVENKWEEESIVMHIAYNIRVKDLLLLFPELAIIDVEQHIKDTVANPLRAQENDINGYAPVIPLAIALKEID